jgi:hypothetical protein
MHVWPSGAALMGWEDAEMDFWCCSLLGCQSTGVRYIFLLGSMPVKKKPGYKERRRNRRGRPTPMSPRSCAPSKVSAMDEQDGSE